MSLEFRQKPYFMPVFFNGEKGDDNGITDMRYHKPATINVISLTYETDREVLEDCIPSCYTLREPLVNVKFCEFFNLPWMAGKSYTLININCPVHFKGEQDDMDGDLVLTMFENHSDPIIGGRESMGYSKYYAEIPLISAFDGKYSCQASCWGMPFLKMTVDTNVAAAPEDIAEVKRVESSAKGKMHYKYIPAVKEKDEPASMNYVRPDCSYPTVLPNFVKPADYPYELKVSESEWGMGSIEWVSPKWEDWPHGFRIGQGLASLKVNRILAARHFTYDDPGVYSTCYRLR